MTDTPDFLKNLVLFTVAKQGIDSSVRITVAEGVVTGLAYDGYIALRVVNLSQDLSDAQIQVPMKDLKAAATLSEALEGHLGEPVNPDWEVIDRLTQDSDIDSRVESSIFEPFAVSPDRLRKFSLVKPGDYPIDLVQCFSRELEALVVAFRIGPHITGRICPLDREHLLSDDKYRGGLWN